MPNDPRVLVLEEMRKQTALLTQILAALKPAAPSVPDSLLNGLHGDPVIRAKDPRDWTGELMTGRRFSECPPDYLDLLADRYEFFASREEDEKKKGYNLTDAKRARGWAARLRAGWTAPVTEPMRAPVDEQGDPTW